MPVVVRWIFTDLRTSATVTLPINPNEGGSPERTKRITELGTAAPDGIPILFEGARPAARLEFSGTLLTEAHYGLLLEWWDKHVTVQIDTDLGLGYIVYFEKFSPKRVRSALYRWKHTYSVSAIVLSEAA